ncbi:MAG: ATPase [Candidatus Magnetoglobus multicellularis str. Araruama]|uniref:ATPase n=1 Tax=Candidatus Magnetoglobus multicellularis str. Araruama TaxID=890399 RepID=A0A1V1P7A5_9BACT|nr:MAG: ATPase [Candidatus Magnetoglobus multicellularis str. Araruama]
MKKKIIYSNEPAFINREKEIKYLLNWINGKPNQLLFIHGPKSSGKTSLLFKFIEIYLNNVDFELKFFNLRKVLISNYENFIQAFFKKDFSKSKGDIKQKREFNFKVFKLTTEILKGFEAKELDPFDVMFSQLDKTLAKGKRPIIIIDEIQALENVYINGQRELLQELFNFFVSLTKESHLCHVIIASSDGYFINRLYNDSKLTKTAAFYEINYLIKDDIFSWLSDLKKNSLIHSYQLSDQQIKTIWKYLGGSIWEISFLLNELIPYANKKKINNADLMSRIQELINVNQGKYKQYAKINKQKRALLKQILSIQNKHPLFDESHLESLVNDNQFDENTLSDALNNLVKLNILAFNPTTSLYTLQGNTMRYGLEAYVKNIS